MEDSRSLQSASQAYSYSYSYGNATGGAAEPYETRVWGGAVFFQVLWCLMAVAIGVSPFCPVCYLCFLGPPDDSLKDAEDQYDEARGAPPPRKGAPPPLYRRALPFVTIFLDAMQVSSIAFLPAVAWRGSLEHDFFAAWAWGLRWAGPHDYQAVFTLVVVAVFVALPALLYLFVRVSPDRAMVRWLTQPFAMTLFNVLFGGLACSTEGYIMNREPLNDWGLQYGVRGRCDVGLPALLGTMAAGGASWFLLLCAWGGFRSLESANERYLDDGGDAMPLRRYYCFLYDCFVNRCLLSFWAAQLGFSTDREDENGLKHLLLVACAGSAALQLVLRPSLPVSGRQHAFRMTAEAFKLTVATCAVADDSRFHGQIVYFGAVGATIVGLMSLLKLCCCCFLRERKPVVRDKFEFDVVVCGHGGGGGSPAHAASGDGGGAWPLSWWRK